MARQPKKREPDSPLEKEAIDRRNEARQTKAQWLLDLRECQFFADPNRLRLVDSRTAPTATRIRDAPELNTDIAFELVDDFVTEITNNYLPQDQAWCERGRGMFVPKEAWDQIAERVKDDDAQIFEAIKASNFYSELPKSYKPDLATGTAAIEIVRRHPSEPITVLAVPIREFECSLGPDGNIDDRFIVRHSRNSYVRALLGDDIAAKLPADLAKVIDDNPAGKTDVSWAHWRKWDRHDDIVWQHTVLVGERMIHDAVLVGEGSCPVLPARFGATADWAWGSGPLMKYLPSLRQVDELERQRLEHAELSYLPPITYPDDSFTNIEQGLEPGMAYPIRPGSEGAVKPIYQPPPANAENYAYEDKVHRLKRGFYVDFPEQTGKTPPTLGQWLDEMARVQRRIGTPGMSFWREGPAQYFLRFKYLLEAAGTIAPLKVDGKAVSARPMNPAQRAAEQQEIAMAVRFLELSAQFFPEEFKVWIDGKATMESLIDKMRVKLVAFRDETTVDTAVNRIKQLIGSQAPGGPGAVAGAQATPQGAAG